MCEDKLIGYPAFGLRFVGEEEASKGKRGRETPPNFIRYEVNPS